MDLYVELIFILSCARFTEFKMKISSVEIVDFYAELIFILNSARFTNGGQVKSVPYR